jgi:hypothetical protein
MTVETSFSLVTVVCGLKRIYHRLEAFIQARLASVVALFKHIAQQERLLKSASLIPSILKLPASFAYLSDASLPGFPQTQRTMKSFSDDKRLMNGGDTCRYRRDLDHHFRALSAFQRQCHPH